jgi:putative DNA-invertase from lambdoid prophage Rac
MGDIELALTRERVRAGLLHARAQGKQLGRPRRVVDRERVMRMKQEGMSLRDIADQLGVGYGTVRMRLAQVS